MTRPRAKIFRNVIYTALAKGTTLVCVTLTSTLVARNLSPSDYGVVAFAGIVIGFLSHFSDVGIGTAAIRRPVLPETSLQTAFTLKIVLGVSAFLVVYLGAPLAHHFFQHPATADVLRVLAFTFLVNTIGFTPGVILTREQNFRALMIPGILSVVARSIITIALILAGWTYWSVVLADLGATVVSSVVLQLMGRTRIGFHFDWDDAREYLRFGAPLLGSGLLIFFLFNLDNLLVGSSMGSIKLGYYALAFTWGSLICRILYDTVHQVLFPAFSAIQHDPAAMRRWYLKTVDLVALLALIANTTLLANAHFFLVTFLGKGSDKWAPATLSLEILCIYGVVRAITEPLANCLLALAQTRSLLHANILAGLIEIGLLVLVVPTGRIELVAGAVLLAYVSQAVVYSPFLRRHLDIGIRDLAAQLWPVIPAMLIGYGTTLLVPMSFGSSLPTLAVRALFTAVVVAVVHGLCTRFRGLQAASEMVLENFTR